tara:strand:- start:317 stop:1012 length:696 start_codon:yes stop_codon:yes gene_type:complete
MSKIKFDKNKLLAPQTAISIRGLKHSEFASHETHCFQASIWLNTDFLTNFMDVGENEDFKPRMILGNVRVCTAENDGRGGATDFNRTQTIKEETWSEFMPLLVREANRIMPLLWKDEDWFTSKDEDPSDVVHGNSVWSSNLECVVAHLINEELGKKEMLRRMKNKLLTYDTKEKKVYARKIKLDPKDPVKIERIKKLLGIGLIDKSITKSSPNEIILNLMPEEEALQLYLT